MVSSVSFEEGFDRVLVDREHAEEDVEEVDDGASVVSGVEDPVQEETVPLDLPEVRDNSPHIREAFRRMDRVVVENIFRRRAVVMKTIPFFLRGPFRVTLRIALAEANAPVVGNCSCCCPECCSRAAQEVASSAKKNFEDDSNCSTRVVGRS